MNSNNIYFSQLVKELKRIADALEESNAMIKNIGDRNGN